MICTVGWDSFSIGYHSDDGTVQFDTDRLNDTVFPVFNTGDIVGCGIIYPPLSSDESGSIFFTNNGTLLRQHFPVDILGGMDCCSCLFPVVVSNM